MACERPKRPINVLWLGPWHSDAALHGRKAVNQAATQWTRGLLRGLEDAGCLIRVCTHCSEQYWPQGDIWPGEPKDFDPTYPLQHVHYANLPFVREPWLAAAYQSMVAREVDSHRPDVVLSYNLAPHQCAVPDILAAQGIKWVPIILDQDDPEPDGWAAFRKQSRGASGLVFLSHWGFRHCPAEVPVLHLDGGVDQWRGKEGERHTAKTVVYSGKYDDRYGGLDKLFEVFAAVEVPGCQFVLTGKDPKNRLSRYLRAEPRAKYFGFVDEQILHTIHVSASAFINPRPPAVADNRMTFPSKLIHYLSYGKPVVSTWTDGLAPEYRDLLLVPPEAAPWEFAR